MSSSQWSLLLLCVLIAVPKYTEADRRSRIGQSPSLRSSNSATADTASSKTPQTTQSSSAVQDAPAPTTEALIDKLETNELTDEPEFTDEPTLEECETDNIGYEIVTG